MQNLKQYVTSLARLLKLADWRFEVSPEPCHDDWHACIQCTEGRKVGVIQVSRQFHGLSREDQRHTIVHELLHAHLHPAMFVLPRLEGLLAPEAASLLADRFETAIEYAVDGMADAIAPFMPLPKGTARASIPEESHGS